MKFGVFLTLLLASSLSVLAQSGRIKPAESPTPKPPIRPNLVYVPTQDVTLTKPSPSPTPKKRGDGEEVVTVESTLIPIPVSVLDGSGRAGTTLKLSDFELQVDGKAADISELSRSESPIRLAMLFDNSSSVLIARD